MDRTREKRFRVALSFAATDRAFVRGVADSLTAKLGRDQVFYDEYFQAELARPNLDTYLLNIYRLESELIVVFTSPDYARSEWGGLEWRAIRELIKTRDPADVMLV